jgi:2-keto-4-pentenoate hydratase
MSSLPTAELVADPRVKRGMEAQLAARRRRIAAGDRPIGWKVGFGTGAAMERLGTGAPLVGFLMESALLEPGSRVSLADWRNPALEPEVAVRAGEDASIAALAPAFELANIHPPPEDVEQILAGNVFQRHVVLRPAIERPTPEGLSATVSHRDSVIEIADPEAPTGPVAPLLRHVADLLGAFGEELRTGDVVIAGSLVPPIAVVPGDEVRYELRPLGAVTIGFDD